MISPDTLGTAYTVFLFACFLIPPWGGELFRTRTLLSERFRRLCQALQRELLRVGDKHLDSLPVDIARAGNQIAQTPLTDANRGGDPELRFANALHKGADGFGFRYVVVCVGCHLKMMSLMSEMALALCLACSIA